MSALGCRMAKGRFWDVSDQWSSCRLLISSAVGGRSCWGVPAKLSLACFPLREAVTSRLGGARDIMA